MASIILFIDLGIGAGAGFAWEKNENSSGEHGSSWIGFVPWTSVMGIRMEL